MLLLVMTKLVHLTFPLLCAMIGSAQFTKPIKRPGADKPVCSPGAICFTGRVAAEEEFRKTLNNELEFVLAPGWNITIVPKHPEGDCNEFASVVNAPYRAHRDIYIDTTYGWTAEDEVTTSPRQFRFVTNCADYRTEFARLTTVMWPPTPEKFEEAVAKLGSSPLGTGRLWITDSKVSHSGDTADNNLGQIEWMSFSVEIRLPASK